MVNKIEYHTVDKSSWSRGPWDNEPDKIQYQDENTGLPCLIVRNGAGALCGYVGVFEAHPWFGKDYGDIKVDVHGGVTFASPCQKGISENIELCVIFQMPVIQTMYGGLVLIVLIATTWHRA